ncbi:MAG: 2-amino-4-hydroxy-6-hydroxymethyldihydropteridine diphosphokinase [Sphingobium sp.]
MTMLYHYVLAMGSNQPLTRALPPARVLDAAIARLTDLHVAIIAISPTIQSAPLGPSRRRFANLALTITTTAGPAALLRLVKRIETELGRRRGQRWAARTIDIDLLLWSGGRVRSRRLSIPHPALGERDFVLKPLQHVAPLWRHPLSGLTMRHLHARRRKARPKG